MEGLGRTGEDWEDGMTASWLVWEGGFGPDTSAAADGVVGTSGPWSSTVELHEPENPETGGARTVWQLGARHTYLTLVPFGSPTFTHRMIGIRTLLALAGLVATSVSAGSVQCTQGAVQGSLCLADCKGNGFYVQAPPLIQGISLPNFELDFNPNNPWGPSASSSGVAVGISIPQTLSAVKLVFTGANSAIGVGLPGGGIVSTLNTGKGGASGDSIGKAIMLNINNGQMQVSDQNGFQQFLKQVTLASGNVPIRLAGYASTSSTASSADSNFPGITQDLCLDYVPFDTTASLVGFGGLTQTQITAVPEVVGSDSNGILLSIPLTIQNPSNVVLRVNSDVTFDLTFNGHVCGSVILPNLSLTQGNNVLTAKSYVNPQGGDAVMACADMLGGFLGGVPQQVVVRNGRALAPLNAALGAIVLPQTLPPSTKPLLLATFLPGLTSLLSLHVETSIRAFNPFGVKTTIVGIYANIFPAGQNTQLGTIGSAGNPLAVNIELPAGHDVISAPMPLSLSINVGAVLEVLQLLRNTAAVDVDSYLTVNFDGFQGTLIHYKQSGVSLTLTSK
ncbi:hypothetical protein HK101_007146 [Irineochytrium annulatum]|nr:hypothetical protein HK101_007146 [Irineochytrium annulatum]